MEQKYKHLKGKRMYYKGYPEFTGVIEDVYDDIDSTGAGMVVHWNHGKSPHGPYEHSFVYRDIKGALERLVIVE